MATPSEPSSLWKVLSESGRIIRLHQNHFRALAALFVFPLSICFLLYPTIQTNLLFALLYSLFQVPSNGFLNFGQAPLHYLLLTLLYSFFVNLFFSFAVASVSHSTYHLSHDVSVDLNASLKSSLHSFWPLVSTTAVVFITEVLIAIPFVLLVLLAFKWLHQSSFFIPVVILLTLILVVVLIHLQVNWILAYVVVVVESKWSYAPTLERSAYLVKGNRGVVLSLLLYFGLSTGMSFWGFHGGSRWLDGCWFLMYMIFASSCLTPVLLFSFVATTVLYVYCRESHEGQPLENPKKFPLFK